MIDTIEEPACDSDFPVFTALHKSEQISDKLIFQSHFLSFLPLTEDVAAKFRLPSPSAYYNYYNGYRTNLDKSLGKIIGANRKAPQLLSARGSEERRRCGPKEAGGLRGHQRDRVLWFMLGAGSVVLALTLLTIWCAVKSVVEPTDPD